MSDRVRPAAVSTAMRTVAAGRTVETIVPPAISTSMPTVSSIIGTVAAPAEVMGVTTTSTARSSWIGPKSSSSKLRAIGYAVQLLIFAMIGSRNHQIAPSTTTKATISSIRVLPQVGGPGPDGPAEAD